MMHQGRMQKAHVEQMSHGPLRAGITATQALPGRVHQVAMDNRRFLNCLTEQSPVTLYTVTTLGIFITKNSMSEDKKYCNDFATEHTEGSFKESYCLFSNFVLYSPSSNAALRSDVCNIRQQEIGL
ncbi:hypothetical protein llap_3992 [Limosa lapponica baueri]|uniref:Uncharacterized protein n=1 Tax=Limosa lapponica baueri TaxID=1758121 RepID=A0A2I0UI37_LIMLA|nr:hypothetical protein llap_3992 [Limosa lapponica baueri]